MADAPIRGDGHTIHQLFSSFQFQLDPYQREYSWDRKDVRVLIEDLANHFLRCWTSEHERRDTARYQPYFLGPFVYYRDGERAALVDGQQRITTLHLLLIHLRRLAIDAERPEYRNDLAALEPLIAGSSYGERAYAIDVPERVPILDAIYDEKPYTLPEDPSPSVANLYARSQELNDLIPETIRDEALPLFIHWLLNRVCLVGINASDRRLGWEIFETMNDRGVQLGPADLLKSFLLRNADNHNNLHRLGDSWRAMLTRLSVLGSQAVTRYLQAVLIGRYAHSLDDAANIDASFHGWAQEHAAARMGLRQRLDFARFIETDLAKLAERFCTLAAAAQAPDPGLEPVFYNAVNELDQMPFLLAALDTADSVSQFRDKARLVASYLDLYYIRAVVNNRTTRPSQVYDECFALIPEIRAHRTIADLQRLLGQRTAELAADFTGIRQYGLRADNRTQVRYLLSRMTAFVEDECGRARQIERYLDRREPFEIEHIWADKFERYQAEVRTESEFRIQRNRLGGLLLLAKSHNASYQAIPYEQKVDYYLSQNQLAASLHATSHKRNKPFTARVVKKHGLEKLFRPFDRFTKDAIETRQRLYERLCEIIWDPERLGFAMPLTSVAPQQVAARAAARRTRAYYGGVTVARLVAATALSVGDTLILVHKGTTHQAHINGESRIELSSGEVFDSPSPAASMVTGKATMNGWSAWKVQRSGKLVTLFDVRAGALSQGLLDQES
ncbi:MAG: DUF262 domain-containing protein [Dactylosporangium sp.]|nr:DUF262 domain-containing protein [Dactylosporangium sp.]NNJ60644.1 DUF262 domain-containing protein [Dactylosporangium sp.]